MAEAHGDTRPVSRMHNPYFWMFAAAILVTLTAIVLGIWAFASSLAARDDRIAAQEALLVAAQEHYDELFVQYSEAYEACARAKDCSVTTDPPATIPDATEGAQSGIPGPAGRDATDAQVSASVERYCLFRNNCEGPIGATGFPGAPGTPGTNGTNGVDGVNGVDGTDGADGLNGADGAPGVGVAAIVCNDDLDWVFTMTDGTVITIEGPCRAEIKPPGQE